MKTQTHTHSEKDIKNKKKKTPGITFLLALQLQSFLLTLERNIFAGKNKQNVIY